MAERMDDLQCKGFRILQDPEAFCFGMDSVLLANYAAPSIRKMDSVLDLGTGNGILLVLTAAKTEAAMLTGIEIQNEAADLAERSAALNNISEKMKIIRGDLREIRSLITASSQNVVLSNPPYMKNGIRNPESRKEIARHEVRLCFEDVAAAAAYSLKSSGKFFLVHRPNRLVDVCTALRAVHLEPKRLRFVYPDPERPSKLFLMEAVKDARADLILEKPFFIYEKPGELSAETHTYYGS